MNLRKHFFRLVSLFGLVFLLSLTSCGGSSALVGKWVPEGGQRVPSNFIQRSGELLKDGTGLADGLSLTWTTENDRLILRLSSSAYAYDYKVSGGTLVLTADNGVTIRYRKE